MQIKVITTTSDINKTFELRRSLIHYGYDFHIIIHPWTGFLSKLHETYKYLSQLKGYTHFLYTDAWDSFAARDAADMHMMDGLTISAECACYPYPELAVKYPSNDSLWKYVNGGGWAGEISAFIKMYEREPPTNEMNDQVYLTNQFLKHHNEGWLRLDYNCEVFQTLAFCDHSYFSYGDYFGNNITKTRPFFIHGNGHTPMSHIYKQLPISFESLKSVQSIWADTTESHKIINEGFTKSVNDDPVLKTYRDWIEEKIFGFGERSFLHMWKLLIKEIPKPYFLEIGVFRGQVLGLIRMLSPDAYITGITPLDATDGHWTSDYAADIKLLHDTFNLKQPRIIKGLSTDADVIAEASQQQYDIIYIDGGHSYEVAKHDVYVYSGLVKVGGYLVIDDCSHKYKLPEGYFKGIESVSKAVDELLPNKYYTEILNVMHNRIFKRIN